MDAFKNEQMNTSDLPYMKSLSLCINRMVLDGYNLDFKVEEEKLMALSTGNTYEPAEVLIKNFFRFEGQSDPDDNSILYVIETTDGGKGTLVDAYGAYADQDVTDFFKKIDHIEKKVSDKNIG